MKVAYFATYYDDFIRAYLAARPEFHTLPYAEQYKRLLAEPFGTFGSYVRAARRAGADAHLLVANFEPLQRQWARENGLAVGNDWQRAVVAAQIRALKPDVLFIGSMFEYYGPFLSGLKGSYGTLAGWISCPTPPNLSLDGFQLVLSSLPSLVESFRARGIRSEVLPAAFDTDVLGSLGDVPKTIPVSFVGGMTGAHTKRKALLEALVARTPLKVWGYGYQPQGRRQKLRSIFRATGLEKAHQGEAWGLDMYRVLAGSRVTINVHIDMAGDAAVNMRMYEATGAGTLLVTDGGKNLAEVFEPGKEVVTYKTPEEAVEKVRFYLSHEKERAEIAAAGQQRTLKNYTYDHVITRMLGHLEKVA